MGLDLTTASSIIDPLFKEGSSYLPYSDIINVGKTRNDLEIFTNRHEPETIEVADFFTSTLNTRGIIINEDWDKILNLPSRILSVNKDYVHCECLIDREQKVFEPRGLPRFLFDHIEDISEGSFILLNIKSKAGSTRLDVYSGKTLVSKEVKALFEINENDNEIFKSDMGQRLTGDVDL